MNAPTRDDVSLNLFCEELGALLQRYGDPSHRVELALTLITQKLGEGGQFFATNTALLGSIGDSKSGSLVFLRRSEPGDIDLGKLARLENVVDEILADRMTIQQAHSRIIEIDRERRAYSRPVQAIAYVIASAGATCFFGGGKYEILVSGAIGLITGILSMHRRLQAARLYEIVAAFVAVIIANLCGLVLSPLSVSTTILGGLIVLFPGLTLTTAILELANRHLVSGSARLTGAILTFLCMALGVVFGTQTINAFIEAQPITPPISLGPLAEIIALLMTPAALTVLFRAEFRDLSWITITAALAYAVVKFGSHSFEPAIAAFLAAGVTGLCGNLYTWTTRRPTSIPSVPSLMILVPGSLGFRSITQLLSDDIITGVESAFNVGIIATAIVAGLLVANALFAPPNIDRSGGRKG